MTSPIYPIAIAVAVELTIPTPMIASSPWIAFGASYSSAENAARRYVLDKRALTASMEREIPVVSLHAVNVSAKFTKIVLGIMRIARPGVIWVQDWRGLGFAWTAGFLNC